MMATVLRVAAANVQEAIVPDSGQLRINRKSTGLTSDFNECPGLFSSADTSGDNWMPFAPGIQIIFHRSR